MFVLGLIVILLAVALLLGATVGGADDRVLFDVGGGFSWDTTVTVIFLLGALALLLLMVGLSLLRTAARRASTRRKESKELSRRSAKLEKREAELRRQEQADVRTDEHTDGPTDNGQRV
jgi:uncharacterized protein HemY